MNKIPKLAPFLKAINLKKSHICHAVGITFDMKNKQSFILDLKDLVRSVLVALIFSLLLVLAFALIVRWASLDNNALVVGNYVIKFLSVLAGVLIGFKQRKNGILKGAILGLTFMLVTFLIFGAMEGFKGVSFNWLDLIFLTIGGGILGVIKVNLPTKKA